MVTTLVIFEIFATRSGKTESYAVFLHAWPLPLFISTILKMLTKKILIDSKLCPPHLLAGRTCWSESRPWSLNEKHSRTGKFMWSTFNAPTTKTVFFNVHTMPRNCEMGDCNSSHVFALSAYCTRSDTISDTRLVRGREQGQTCLRVGRHQQTNECLASLVSAVKSGNLP